jgi:hypothetical protein
MAAEADGSDIEDKWVTSVYYVACELCKFPEEIRDMSASSFQIFLEEANKKAEREKAESKKAHKFR